MGLGREMGSVFDWVRVEKVRFGHADRQWEQSWWTGSVYGFGFDDRGSTGVGWRGGFGGYDPKWELESAGGFGFERVPGRGQKGRFSWRVGEVKKVESGFGYGGFFERERWERGSLVGRWVGDCYGV